MTQRKKIIVFAPHPDDETLGCGGTIAKKIAEGYEVLIVVMTDGRFLLLKGYGIDCDPTPEEVKEIRKGEVLRATKILGVPEDHVVFLGFVDGSLGENEGKAFERVVDILRSYNPCEVYFPYEKDSHVDHVVTNRVVKRAVERLGLKPKMYKYTIIRRMARLGPIIDSIIDIFKRNRAYIDISKFLSLKEVAVKEFKSELAAISSKQSRPRAKSFNKFLKKEEAFFIDK